MVSTTVVAVLAAIPLTPLLILALARLVVFALGKNLRTSGHDRRAAVYLQFKKDQRAALEAQNSWEKVDAVDRRSQNQWTGIVGFFHPFCNAGGGGERVLWAAIAATQRKFPNAICAVYTGDHEIDRQAIVDKVKERFDITLQYHTLHFIYLSKRRFVLASTYPHFTLLGQSLGSLILAYDAFSLLVPDIFIDTMGYAFATAFCKRLLPLVPTGAYVHYPTISTDMLESLDDQTGTKGIHSGAGSGWKGRAKKIYWHIFAWTYGWVGKQIDVVMCNSTWTSSHISKLWKLKKPSVVYPPCPVEELESKIEVTEESEKKRESLILYIAQFRPEKNHSLILQSFAKYCQMAQDNPRLVMIGSVRSNTPDERHIYNLRLEARELKINEATSFICDAPFSVILEHLQIANISVNGMYSEHFGIGNVEGLAAGLIPVVHNSGGPKLDIVVPFENKPIGYHAETAEEYADAFNKVAKLSTSDRIAMRIRARRSSHRFTEKAFAEKWIESIEVLVKKAGQR